MRPLVPFALYVAVAGVGLAPSEGAVAQGASESGPAGTAYGGNSAALAAAFTTLPDKPRAGETAELRFVLTDGAGRPPADLVTHHGRKLHVVLISEDMQVFGHVHPQDFGDPIENGEASVRFAFPRPGRYVAAADAMTESGPYAEHFVVTVAGDAVARAPATPAPASLVVVEVRDDDVHAEPVLLDAGGPTDGYEVSVAGPGAIAAGDPATFTWRLSKGGEPVTDLRLFLDAPMHLAVVRDDLEHFQHGHGLAKGLDTGYDHTHGPGGAEGDGADMPELEYFGPEITATVTFPKPGRYYLFGQSVHGEALLISRIPVEVGG